MFYAELTVVTILSDDLRGNYKTRRQRPHGEEWPPYQPSSIVNLALIHYKDRRTQQELIEIHKRCKEGASHVDDLTATRSNVTTDIMKLFIPDAISNESPKRILIEGAPGIGKTILAKEIAYQWANGEILKENKLLFLLYLRDPEVHKVTSVNEIIELFTSKNTPDLQKYVSESREINVAFVFDGFDEYPVALQKKSFITDFIKGFNHYGNDNSTVVVTSRPTATLFLHGVVDRRIEVLGFPKMEREKYISLSLKDSVYKAQDLNIYLKQHPIINNLSYIPLHLAILIYLFKQNNLPKTLTEMNESFIINTIYRYLERNKLSPSNVVKKLEDLPTNIVEFIYKLSQLAFEGLQENQLVFTLDEIRKMCPEVGNIPGAINGFGLLQAVQHYPKGGAGRTTSVNFLHFTMQEYLAALHVSTLPSDWQSSLMKGTFWDGQFNFMWMMYVGIVGVKSKTFASFIASDINSESYSDNGHYLVGKDSIYNDKRKCLHLFQCYMEAKSDAEMPRTISSIFTDGKIVLDNITLYPHHISSLIFFMSSSSMQQWKMLKLGHCNLGDIGMNSLLEHVIKNDENISTLEYVDLTGNGSSPWGVYCAIIRHCCVDSLTLYGEEGMAKYVKEIADSLEANEFLQSLTLHKIGKTGVQTIGDVLDNNTTLRQLNISVKSEARTTTKIIHRKLMRNKFGSSASGSNSHEGVVDINVLYRGDHKCSSEVISVSKLYVSYDELFLIAFGLYNNTTVIKLDLSCNNISDDKAVLIGDCLKYNNTLQELDISHSNLSDNGAASIGDYLGHNNALKELNLSQNCITIRGMNTLLVHINYSILLEYVNLSGNDLSCNNISDDKAVLIGDCLKYNNTLQILDISHSNLSDNGAASIGDYLGHNNALKELNLSQNCITIRGMNTLLVHINYSSLEYVDLSGNDSSPWGVYCAVIKHCSGNSLTLCGCEGMIKYFKEITDNIQINTILRSLTLYVSRHPVDSYKNVALKAKSNNTGILVLDGKLFCNTLVNNDEEITSNSNNRVVNIRVLASVPALSCRV